MVVYHIIETGLSKERVNNAKRSIENSFGIFWLDGFYNVYSEHSVGDYKLIGYLGHDSFYLMNPQDEILREDHGLLKRIFETS